MDTRNRLVYTVITFTLGYEVFRCTLRVCRLLSSFRALTDYCSRNYGPACRWYAFRLFIASITLLLGLLSPLHALQSIAPPFTLALLGTLYIVEAALVQAGTGSKETVYTYLVIVHGLQAAGLDGGWSGATSRRGGAGARA
jgi:hypothetical protein